MVLDIPRSMLTNPKYYASANSKLSSADITFISNLYPRPEATLRMTFGQASVNLEIPNILYIDWGDDIKQNDIQNETNIHTLSHQYKDGITKHNITIYGAVTVIYCQNNKITEFEYIKTDTNLLTLVCPNNNLAALDVSLNKTLVVLNCNENPLTSLKLNNNISTLQCQKTSLSDLDLSIASNLHTAYCDQNDNLQKITINNPNLRTLYVNNNKLTSLNINGSPNLTTLDCSRNSGLKEIDLSPLSALGSLLCEFNDLSSLDISHNTQLIDIVCDGNKLTVLDIGQNTKLLGISCRVNAITELDLSKCPDLQSLDCSYNPLSTLDFSQTPHIHYINCTADDFASDYDELINIARTLPRRPEDAKGSFIIGNSQMKEKILSEYIKKFWLVDQMYSGVARTKSITPKTKCDELYELREIRPGFFTIINNIGKL